MKLLVIAVFIILFIALGKLYLLLKEDLNNYKK